MKYLHVVLLLGVALTGCRSLPALHYYSLAAVAPTRAPEHPPAAPLVRIRHVAVPHEMDHLGLTHHVGATQLAISDNDQWTAPLNTLIQAALTQDLGARLGYERVLAPDALPVASHPNAPAAPQATLDLDFVALSADDRCGIAGQVNWVLTLANGTSRRGTAPLAGPASGCPGGLPTALSSALGDLADQLSAQLSAP